MTTKAATKIKPWFRVNKDVEYSTDFTFFKFNQARLVKSGNKYTFCSRLEAKTFKTERALNSTTYEFTDTELINKWKEIHAEIIAGKHHEGGKLVD